MHPIVRDHPPEPRLLEAVHESLNAGHCISKAALEAWDLEEGSTVRMGPLAPFGTPLRPPPPPNSRWVQIDSSAGDAALAKYFESTRCRGTVVIEETNGRRSDPFTEAHRLEDEQRYGIATGYCGDNITYWIDFEGRNATELVSAVNSTSPWPALNAFIVRIDAATLGLRRGKDISDRIPAIVDAACAVIIDIFDGESFGIWERPDPVQAERP